MLFENSKNCYCGKEHISDVSSVITGSGAISKLPDELRNLQRKKAFIVADVNTYPVAGKKVENLLLDNNIYCSKYVFSEEHLKPDEKAVGSVVMHYDCQCDVVIGVGSGVINDICKILSNIVGCPYIIVATAPSMDGYASATSSMTMGGLKVSLSSKCADVIIGDSDILCQAPMKMMISGLGDMVAKYVSICEWRISNLINDEYYCENIARLVRQSLEKCTDNLDGLLNRDEYAVNSVFEGLVICGMAMQFAGVTRPASGGEHYLSHIWDMRGAEFNTPVEYHGIQVAVGTLMTMKIYEKIKEYIPNEQKAIEYVKNFDFSQWTEMLRVFLGKSSESMIVLEEREQKYNIAKHKVRLKRIIEKWDEILKIMEQELPSYTELEKLFIRIGLPTTMSEIGLNEELLPMTFKASKDIRDKYVLSRLCWDLGIIDDIL